jgi:hypothetical protein
VPSSTRDKDATWQSLGTLCRDRDWSKRRLLDELENERLCFRTIPEGHEREIDWRDPNVQRSLDVEASEVSFHDDKKAVAKRDRSLVILSLGRVTVGIEVLPPAPTDAGVPAAKWAAATTRRLRAEGKIPKRAMKVKAEFARFLAAESEKAVPDHRKQPLKASYLENQLELWGIWPLSNFK